MSQSADHGLSGVAETLLIPVYVRALESAREDALLKDEAAVMLVSRAAPAFERIKRIAMDEGDRTALILRNREFDRYARTFLAVHPGRTVVHIGCGFDARFERVDDGTAEWYDLDLPEVAELRRRYLGSGPERYHLLSCSVFDDTWFDAVSRGKQTPLLFLAEGVFMYFEEEQVKTLFRTLCGRFPGSELVFDAFSPFLIRANNLRLRISRSGITARYRWGLKHGKELERWCEGARLLDEWFPFDHPEPRLNSVRWVRHFPMLAKAMGIRHYRLGSAAT